MRQIEISLDVHRLIENARRSFEETESDILWRLLDPSERSRTTLGGIDPAICETPTSRNETAIPIGRRTTGQWLVRAGPDRYVARNLREAYLTALSRIAEQDPGVLEKLAREGDGRRRIVAHKPADLYPRSPHLADPRRGNWHQLGDWFVDLNLSRDQAAKRIRRACALAGLRYGADLTIMDNLSAL